LPTYPFEGERHWFSPVQAGNAEVRKKTDPLQWIYVPSWKRLPASGGEMPKNARWLVFADECGFGAVLAARLESAGVKHELVTWDDLDHHLEDSAARTEMLRKSEAFLRQAIGEVP